MSLERPPPRAGTGPYHKLGTLVRQPFPDLGEVDIKADRKAHATEVRLVNRNFLAGNHRWREAVFRKPGENFVVNAGHLTLAIKQDGGVKPLLTVPPVDGTNDVGSMFLGQV